LHPPAGRRQRDAARHRLELCRAVDRLFRSQRSRRERSMKRARGAPPRHRPLGADQRRIAEIVPPEGVPLHFEVAGLGARLAAQIVDVVITLGAAVAIILLTLLVQLDVGPSLSIIVALFFFFVRTPYYVATELLWNGQTI